MKELYHAHVHVTGGRDGGARSDDGLLDVKLALPKALGGSGAATNPEQLFAAGFAGCFTSSIKFAATFTVIAYVGPIVTAIAGLTGSGIGAMQALIGVGSIAGIAVGGRAADRPETRRFLAASFLVSAFALSGYSALMGIDAHRSWVIALLSLAMMTGAAALFARTPVIQTRLVTAAPGAARPVVLALNGSMMFAGQGLGAAIGGVVIAEAGIGLAGYAAGTVAAGGAVLAFALLRPSPTSSVREHPASQRT